MQKVPKDKRFSLYLSAHDLQPVSLTCHKTPGTRSIPMALDRPLHLRGRTCPHRHNFQALSNARRCHEHQMSEDVACQLDVPGYRVTSFGAQSGSNAMRGTADPCLPRLSAWRSAGHQVLCGLNCRAKRGPPCCHVQSQSRQGITSVPQRRTWGFGGDSTTNNNSTSAEVGPPVPWGAVNAGPGALAIY